MSAITGLDSIDANAATYRLTQSWRRRPASRPPRSSTAARHRASRPEQLEFWWSPRGLPDAPLNAVTAME